MSTERSPEKKCFESFLKSSKAATESQKRGHWAIKKNV